jgi:hypothetical protein
VELRRARLTESVFSVASAVFFILTLYAVLGDVESFGGLAPERAGVLSLVCAVGCTMIAAGGGIRRRLVLLADEIEARLPRR